MPDYIPHADGELLLWLVNLKTKLPTHQAALGLSADQVKAVQDQCDALTAALHQKTAKKTEYDEAVMSAGQASKTILGGFRAQIARWKTEPGYTDAIGQALMMVGGAEALNADALQPGLTAVVQRDHVQLRFKKYGADAVNLYKRKAGETAWKFLARDTNSPYDDFSPLEKPGVPENWEYQALAVLGDDEAGQPSAVVRATFGG